MLENNSELILENSCYHLFFFITTKHISPLLYEMPIEHILISVIPKLNLRDSELLSKQHYFTLSSWSLDTNSIIASI